MSDYNSLTLREFIKLKGGNKIVNGIGARDIIIMNENNQTVAVCYLSSKIEKWLIEDIIKTDLIKGDIEYQVYLEPHNKKYCIYPLEITTIL